MSEVHSSSKKGKRRRLELVVISDVHLGTYGSHATELLNYLRSVKPKHLILNGDIVDMWQFKKKYWPSSHTQVLKEILSLSLKGCQISYITGNHDELLRKFAGFQIGNISISNRLSLTMDQKKMLFFHGDVFDVTMQYSRWLTKLGAISYDLLIMLNRFVNIVFDKLGKERISLSKKIKNSVKKAVSYINDFESLCIDMGRKNNYDYVICGHIHQPEMKEDVEIAYLNSGDWVENLTALEYDNGEWSIHRHPLAKIKKKNDSLEEVNVKQLFDQLLFEMNQPIS